MKYRKQKYECPVVETVETGVLANDQMQQSIGGGKKDMDRGGQPDNPAKRFFGEPSSDAPEGSAHPGSSALDFNYHRSELWDD